MAKVTSGSFNTTAYSGRYLQLSWSATQDIAKNQSIIKWELKGLGGSATTFYKAGNFKVIIAGEVVYSSSTRISLYGDGKAIASGSKTITHNNDGSKSFAASAEAGIYYYDVNCKGSGSWELKDIPRAATITSAPNFTDEASPKITYSNIAGSAVSSLQACITDNTGNTTYAAYRAISISGTEYTFNLTAAERKALRVAIKKGNSLAVRFYLKTTINGVAYYSYVAKTLSLVDYTPTLSPSIQDVNAAAQQLIGNNPSKIIKGFNTMAFSVGAAARKEATIVSQSVSCKNKSSSSASGELTNAESNEFIFSATDSRGFTVTQTVKLSMIEYVKVTSNQIVKPEIVGGSVGKAAVTLSGNYFSGSFGAQSNTLSISYAYKEQNGSYSAWQSVNAAPSISENSYTISFDVNNLDYSKTYVLKCRAADAVGTAETAEYIVKFIPVFYWNDEKAVFNVPVSIEGQPVNDFVVDQGSSGIWSYRLWNSGKAECWGRVTKSLILNKAWGSMYIGTTTFERVSYPFVFMSTPTETVTLQTAGGAGWLFPESAGNGINGAYQTAVYNVCRPTAVATGINFTLSYYINGLWR